MMRRIILVIIFAVLGGLGYFFFAADKQNIDMNKGYYIENGQVLLDGSVIENADPTSFRHVHGDVYRDKDAFYQNGKIIDLALLGLTELAVEQVSPSFEEMDIWSKDDQGVYYGGNIIEGADVDSFEIINFSWARDKDHIYSGADVIEGAHPTVFDTVGSLVRLSNGIYMGDKKVDVADVINFQELNPLNHPGYYKDSRHVYKIERDEERYWEPAEFVVVKGADPETYQPK
jgi:hypothetical protein